MHDTTNQPRLKQFTRGGQTLLHNLRMFTQVLLKTVFALIIAWVFAVALWLWLTIPHNAWSALLTYAEAQLIVPFEPEFALQLSAEGGTMTLPAHEVLETPWLLTELQPLFNALWQALWVGLLSLGVTSVLTFGYLTYRGNQYLKTHHVRGDERWPARRLARRIRRSRQASDLHLANLPMVQGSECQHLLFHGSTGTGKSNAIQQLMAQIRERGDRAIVYDKSGSLLQHFYRQDQDKILNPLDERSESWHLWHECRDSVDYDNLAAAQIPIPPNVSDPFWLQGARTIFAATAHRMRQDEDRSVTKLIHTLLESDLKDLEHYLQGTEASSLVSTQIEKTATSMKAILATYLKSLRYVKDDSNPLSIRQWVHDDTRDDWLFVSSLGDRHETLRPLITAWLDIAINALLSLPPDPDRRVWFILDELTSLQKLPYLTAAAAEGRKFGGCLVLGLQSYAQLAQRYGADGAKELSSLCNTRVLFRQPDPEMAQWAAKNLGQRTLQEPQEGVSYGANTIRDGISLQTREINKPVVTYSEIMQQPNLHSFVRLPGDWPITQLHWEYVSREAHHAPFIGRPLENAGELDAMLRRYPSDQAATTTSNSTNETVETGDSTTESAQQRSREDDPLDLVNI